MTDKGLKITVVKDGQPIPQNIVKKFNLQIRDYATNLQYDLICDFVGIVRRENEILFAMPKHYMSIESFNKLSLEKKINHIKLILNVVFTYEKNLTYDSFENDKDLKTDFSFEAYFKIYDYFKKYGLFYDKKENIEKGYKGHLSWHKILSSSKKIISHNNLILFPFYVNKRENSTNLITKAMAFAINYTYYVLGDFVDLPNAVQLASWGVDKDMENNSSSVAFQLENLQNKIFKDADKELLNELIIFFRGLSSSKNNATKDFKQYHFNDVWEKAVELYLNDYFLCIHDDNFIFDSKGSNKHFKKIALKNYNVVKPHDILQPDHYYLDESEDKQYIFDSKYYTNLHEFDHKQFVYHILLMNRAAITYDALIVPTSGKTRTQVFVNINASYLPKEFNHIKIYLEHINMTAVLKNFI